MKKALKFLGYGLLVVFFIVALLLSAAPTVLEKVASAQYAERVPEGELQIDDININYFSGRVQLHGVHAQKAQQQVLSLGVFEVDIAMLDLMDGLVVVEDVKLADFAVEIDLSKQRIIAAGYEHSLEQPVEKPIEKSVAKVEEVQGAAEQLVEEEPAIKGLRLKRLDLDNVKVHFINADINAHATVDSLRVENFDTQQPEQQTLLDMQLSIDGVKLKQQGKHFVIPAGAQLTLQAKLSQLLEDPVVLANMSLSQLVVQATDISTQLIALQRLELKGVDYSSSGVGVDEVKLQDVQGINADGAEQVLVGFEELLVSGIQLPALKSLIIDSVTLSALNADVVLDEQRQLEKLQPVLDYLAAAEVSPESAEAEAEPEPEAKPETDPESKPEAFTVSLGSVDVDGEIYFKDKAINPAFERTIKLEQLAVSNLNTADTATYTDLVLKASLGEYSKIDLNGQLQALAKNPSGFLKGSISGVELVPLSPYAIEATGYFIRTGHAKANIDVSLKAAELGGEVEVILSAIKLAPGDKEKMEQLKSSISMPLDVALGLLRDKNGDVDLKLPMQGNVNAPDFSLASVMGQVSKKVLKKATIVGLKHAFQPYGAMISVGSWLGKKAAAVRLDPLTYAPGETAITDEQKKYLAKVGEIMTNKEGLRIKLCAQSTPAERKALHQAALAANPEAQPIAEEKLVGFAKQRAERVRQHLVETAQIEASRLLLCQPSYNEKADDKQSLVHLEI